MLFEKMLPYQHTAEKKLIRWLRNLELGGREEYAGETVFMFHEIIHALMEFHALKMVITDEDIKINKKKLNKYNPREYLSGTEWK